MASGQRKGNPTNKVTYGNKLSVGHAPSQKKGDKRGDYMKESIRELIRSKVDWSKKIEELDKMSSTRQIMNGNGRMVTAEPDLNAMRILLDYGWGRPTDFDALADPQTVALKNLAIALAANIIPAQEEKSVN